MQSDFVTPKWNNSVYKKQTGKLYQFLSRSVTVFSQAWPRPRAWIKTPSSDGWRNFRPTDLTIPGGDLAPEIRRLSSHDDGQLLFPFGLSRHRRLKTAELCWFRDIPTEIRDRIARYHSRTHWYLLSFLARCGQPAADLVDSNPALAFMLALNELFHAPSVNRPLRAARSLLRRKQHAALEWIGFPGSRSVRNITAKIKPQSISIDALTKLKDVLTVSPIPGARKRLSHLETLNDGTLRIICDPDLSGLVSGGFLRQTGRNRQDDVYSKTVDNLFEIHRLWTMLRPFDRLPVVRCRQQMIALQSELKDEQSRLNRLTPQQSTFPPPPLPADGERIVPIRDIVELIQEGRRQNNCVADLLNEVVQGRRFIYRVDWPERCTLSVESSDGAWQMGQLKRACNQAPSPATCQYVTDWINTQGTASVGPT
jgi:hypothetical protein